MLTQTLTLRATSPVCNDFLPRRQVLKVVHDFCVGADFWSRHGEKKVRSSGANECNLFSK